MMLIKTYQLIGRQIDYSHSYEYTKENKDTGSINQLISDNSSLQFNSSLQKTNLLLLMFELMIMIDIVPAMPTIWGFYFVS